MMNGKIVKEGITFDDVLLIPAKSDVLPNEVSLKTRLTKKITLNLPILSAAMDTVTESDLAIALARQGGMGFIHKNMSIEEQAAEVDRVKRSESGMITNPITLNKDSRVYQAEELMSRYKISGLPVIEDDGKLIGIITNRDIKYRKDLDQPVGDIMTSKGLITAPVGTTLEQAKEILLANRIEKLPITDQNGYLKGLITIKDIDNIVQYPNACKDKLGKLRCGAAVGIAPDTIERVSALVKAGVDIITVDSAHGHPDCLQHSELLELLEGEDVEEHSEDGGGGDQKDPGDHSQGKVLGLVTGDVVDDLFPVGHDEVSSEIAGRHGVRGHERLGSPLEVRICLSPHARVGFRVDEADLAVPVFGVLREGDHGEFLLGRLVDHLVAELNPFVLE